MLASIALLVLTTGAALDAGAPRCAEKHSGDRIETTSFSACGIVQEGKDCTRLFRPDQGDPDYHYLLDSYGDFWGGDHVLVTGTLDTGCLLWCIEADACIRENSIVLCPTAVEDRTWANIKHLFR